jgi:hypothetical protein
MGSGGNVGFPTPEFRGARVCEAGTQLVGDFAFHARGMSTWPPSVGVLNPIVPSLMPSTRMRLRQQRLRPAGHPDQGQWPQRRPPKRRYPLWRRGGKECETGSCQLRPSFSSRWCRAAPIRAGHFLNTLSGLAKLEH